ncbi:MAG: type II 3-dehydroquinate dehydratase, partial [Pseudomonadota bacterium]|nr:type II 3-dehydroquinate dehydratase [Pseudomonadota bacterium]
ESQSALPLPAAINETGVPVNEVHLSHPGTREGFRHLSYVGIAAVDEVKGLGPRGYAVALEKAAAL